MFRRFMSITKSSLSVIIIALEAVLLQSPERAALMAVVKVREDFLRAAALNHTKLNLEGRNISRKKRMLDDTEKPHKVEAIW